MAQVSDFPAGREHRAARSGGSPPVLPRSSIRGGGSRGRDGCAAPEAPPPPPSEGAPPQTPPAPARTFSCHCCLRGEVPRRGVVATRRGLRVSGKSLPREMLMTAGESYTEINDEGTVAG